MPERFEKLYREAIARAVGIVEGVKSVGYTSGGVSIRDYSKYFGLDLHAYEIHKKALRLVSITSSKNPEGKNLQEGLDDTLLDIINYAAFAYAESTLRQEEALADQTPFSDVREARLAAGVKHCCGAPMTDAMEHVIGCPIPFQTLEAKS